MSSTTTAEAPLIAECDEKEQLAIAEAAPLCDYADGEDLLTQENTYDSDPQCVTSSSPAVVMNRCNAFTSPNRRAEGVVAKRVGTPDRIRFKAARLYDEVHELIDRHATRAQRQKEIERRDSGAARRESSLRAASSAGSHAARESAVSGGWEGHRHQTLRGEPHHSHQPLPDLYATFEESRRRHLQDAQTAKSNFPPISKPTDMSSKDPDGFSLRFHSLPPGRQSGR